MASDPNPGSASTSGWFLVIIACLVAVIPVFGVIAWLISGPMLIAAFILSIISMSRGQGGVGLLLSSCFCAPLFIIFAPIVSTMAVGKTAAGSASGLADATQTRSPLEKLRDRVEQFGVSTQPAAPAPTLEPSAGPAKIEKASGPIVDESKRKLLQIYPEIGRAGSAMNAAYLAAVKKAEAERPEIFDEPTWPLIVATDLAPKTEVKPRGAPKPSNDWMWGPSNLDPPGRRR